MICQISTVPSLVARLEQAEKTILELTKRVEQLEKELANGSTIIHSDSSGGDPLKGWANGQANGHRHTSPELNGDGSDSDNLANQNNGQLKSTGVNGNEITNMPPPAPPSIDNFKFTSTPNPVFLSRGKLHDKAKAKNVDISEIHQNSPKKEDGDGFQKSKKQRYFCVSLSFCVPSNSISILSVYCPLFQCQP